MSYLEQLKNKVESEATAETSVTDNVQNENVSSDDVQTAEEVTHDSPSETLSETQTEQTIEQDTVVSTQENQPTVTETQQTVFANEELAKINEFVKRTGKGVEDYYAPNERHGIFIPSGVRRVSNCQCKHNVFDVDFGHVSKLNSVLWY